VPVTPGAATAVLFRFDFDRRRRLKRSGIA